MSLNPTRKPGLKSSPQRYWLIVLLAVGFIGVACLLAQIGSDSGETTTTSAAQLLEVGKPEEAKSLLASISTNDPAYPAAQRYHALCLHELKDYHGFMNAIESLDLRAAVVPPEIRERLAYKQIDGLFFIRKFEDIFPAIQVFQTEHPASSNLGAVTEYQLAALFERGLKKTLEASKLKDETLFNKRWTEGRTNLEQFLSLAASCGATNYGVLLKRNLSADLWAARIILGDGTAALDEIPGQDAATREKFSLLRVLLYPKIQPDNADQNLQKMSAFLQEFPQSRSRPKVEFEMANVALCEGDRLFREGWLADVKTAEAKRASAAPYLATALGLFSRVVEDKDAGIGETEMRESRVRIFRTLFAQEDWPNVSHWRDQLIANSPEEKERLVVESYYGVGLARQGKLAEAASKFDEVLAIGFRNTPSYDGPLLSAAKWRIHVARLTRDEASALRVYQLVQKSDCYNSLKENFMKGYSSLATQAEPISR